MSLKDAINLVLRGEEVADVNANDYCNALQMCMSNMPHNSKSFTIADVVKWAVNNKSNIS